jgi:RimJ/RimL family protein N-acetyltransferase
MDMNLMDANLDRPSPLLIRPLTEADGGAFGQLCAQDHWRYLTPRLNVEAHGLHGSVVRGWGAFRREDGEMAGVMLRYGNTAIIADANGATADGFAAVIDAEAGIAGVRGTIEVVRAIRRLLRRYASTGIENSVFMRLVGAPRCAPQTLALARRAGPEDLDLLAELYAGAWSMYRSRSNVASKLQETRVFVVEEPATGRRPRRIASCALLNVEGSDAGLIGGVYTLGAVRGRGYAAACTAALSLDLQRDGKYPCLFYENPVAGRVYERLGFEAMGQWAVLYLDANRK